MKLQTQKDNNNSSNTNVRKAEESIALVRIAHKIKSYTNKDQKQIIKLGDKYFTVKELG